MVKIILIFIYSLSFAGSFDKCLKCHKDNAPDLENIYYRYIQIYGSNKRTKDAMIKYLTNPTKEKSALPFQAVNKFGTHTKIDNKTISKDIDDYISTFNIYNRINIINLVK